MKTQFFKIRADHDLALVVREAMSRTGLGQGDVLRLGALRGVPEITSALTQQNRPNRLPEPELKRRIQALKWQTHLTPSETEAAHRRGRK